MTLPPSDISGLVIQGVREGYGVDDLVRRHRLCPIEVRRIISQMRRKGWLVPEFFAPLPMRSVPWPPRARG